MIRVNFKMLSSSFVTRERGQEAFKKLQDLITNKTQEDPILFEHKEDKLISFSFLDELLQKCSDSLTNKFMFLIPSGAKSNLYRKLARISGLRNIKIEYIESLNGTPQKVIPQSPSTLPEVVYEEKPKSDE